MGMWRTDSFENFSDLPHSPTKAREAERRRDEADERLRTAVSPLVPKEKAPAEDKRPFLDTVREQLPGISLAQRERWKRENYEARRAEHIRATSNTKPTEADIAAVNAEADRINSWLDSQVEQDADNDWDDDEDERY